MTKPRYTQTRCGTLAAVFSVNEKELHILIACLCVLFEDLRIEIAGQAADDLGGLDECGKTGRRLYFIRRSLATLHEFADTLQKLNQLPSFQPIKARFDKVSRIHWARAIAYFHKSGSYIARIRNQVGGHFGAKGGQSAVECLLPDASGAIELILTDNGGGAKLLFATELVATRTLRQVPGPTSTARARKLVRHAVVGYRKAVWAVDCITVNYLWDRFGRH
jgi:hypothetical protein